MATVHTLHPQEPDNRVPIGSHSTGTLSLDLDRLLAGRLLIQGSSGAGKSRTLRRIIEEAFDFVTTMIVDPEGEFGNLAEHIGSTTLRAAELTADGLTAAATRGRRHRLPLHLDLTDLDPDQRIIKAAAFFAGLIGAPREDWAHTVLVCIDEGHLLAPHHAGSARDAETRRLGVATLTDLAARGRKRGIAPIIQHAARTGQYALALVDLDRFKRINDALGHGAGDVVLANVARSIARAVGDKGMVARWGGEEFLVVLPKVSLERALSIIEHVRAEVEDEYAMDGVAERVTISAGVAHGDSDQHPNGFRACRISRSRRARRGGTLPSIDEGD